jgi:hypothetical protein
MTSERGQAAPDMEEDTHPYPWREGEPHPRFLVDGFRATKECHARIVTLPPQARVSVAAILNAHIFSDGKFHAMDVYESMIRAGEQIEQVGKK